MEKEIKIYCLCDPITCKIRYIGRTTKDILEHRLIEHITKSKYFEKYYPRVKKTHKVNWINSLLDKGIEPKIKLLCLVKGWEASYVKEKELISKYKCKYDLTNANDRGDGGLNKTVTEEQKIKIREKLKSNYIEGYKNPKNRKIYVYDLEGNLKHAFESIAKCVKELKVGASGVHRCLRKEHKQNAGYQFFYEKQLTIPVIDLKQLKSSPRLNAYKSIDIFDKLTKETLTFSSYKEAQTKLNISNISSAIRQGLKVINRRYVLLVPEKSSELLETLKASHTYIKFNTTKLSNNCEDITIDNQQPSLSSNALEGSTTNARIQSDNTEDSNGNTSARH